MSKHFVFERKDTSVNVVAQGDKLKRDKTFIISTYVSCLPSPPDTACKNFVHGTACKVLVAAKVDERGHLLKVKVTSRTHLAHRRVRSLLLAFVISRNSVIYRWHRMTFSR